MSAQAPTSAVLTPSELFEKVSPCVVKIVAKDEDGRPIGTGSGFVISPNPEAVSDYGLEGWIVTNHHVVRAAVSAAIEISLRRPDLPQDPNGNVVSVEKLFSVEKVAAEDKRNDLAVLALLGDGVPILTLGADTVPPIGTRVFVISSPEGLKNTLSEGLISGFREQENGEQWIQITAPISPGSSGGPVLTADGKVIGVVVASHEEGQNLNFAVPVSAIRRLLAAPAERRPIWKGTSIREEENEALRLARWRLRYQLCGADKIRDGEQQLAIMFGIECDAKVREKAESGDQLALLVQARDEYQLDSPKDCVALATLKRAIEAKTSEWAYLAYYSLGKLMSTWDFCGSCILQKKSYGWDEIRAQCQDPAIPLLKKSTELHPKFSPSFAQLADTYLKTERYPEALVAAEFLVALVPNCWKAYLLRGQGFAHLGRIAAADEDFAGAEKLRPNWFDLQQQIYETYSASDIREYRKAVAASARALALPLPTDEKELKTRQQERLFLWYNTGFDYERLSDLNNAARAYEEAHRLSPGRVRPSDIQERIARCRAGLPGDGKRHDKLVLPE